MTQPASPATEQSSQCAQASNEDLCASALAHYDHVSTVAHEWNNQIPQAIKAWYAAKAAPSETAPLFKDAKLGAQLEEDGSVTPAMPATLGPLVNALRPVVSDIFDRFGSLSRGQALQMLVNALASIPSATERTLEEMNRARNAAIEAEIAAEDAARYRWFRDECDYERRFAILEASVGVSDYIDHHIDKGRCGL